MYYCSLRSLRGHRRRDKSSENSLKKYNEIKSIKNPILFRLNEKNKYALFGWIIFFYYYFKSTIEIYRNVDAQVTMNWVYIKKKAIMFDVCVKFSI